MTVGMYYYPERWSPLQWERDIKQISAMGFEFIHLAGFAWAQMEPEEGKYDFEWLDRVMNLAGKYNLKVVLCTPSAAPPLWLGIMHPETYIMNSNYLRAEHGTRVNGSLANKTFREYVEKFNTDANLVGWWGSNPHALLDYKRFTADVQAAHWLALIDSGRFFTASSNILPGL